MSLFPLVVLLALPNEMKCLFSPTTSHSPNPKQCLLPPVVSSHHITFPQSRHVQDLVASHRARPLYCATTQSHHLHPRYEHKRLRARDPLHHHVIRAPHRHDPPFLYFAVGFVEGFMGLGVRCFEFVLLRGQCILVGGFWRGKEGYGKGEEGLQRGGYRDNNENMIMLLYNVQQNHIFFQLRCFEYVLLRD